MIHKYQLTEKVRCAYTGRPCKVTDIVNMQPFMAEPLYEIEYEDGSREMVSESSLYYLEQSTLPPPVYSRYNGCQCGSKYSSEPDFHMFFCPEWRRFD